MRSIIVLLLVLGALGCLSTTSYAQFQRGDWLTGGTMGFNHTQTYTSTNSGAFQVFTANIDPYAAWAIGKHAVIGLDLGFSSASYYANTSTVTLDGDLFFKRYMAIKNKFGCYVKVYGGIGWSKNKNILSDITAQDSLGLPRTVTTNTRNYAFGMTAGLYYQVSSRLLLNIDLCGLQYSRAIFGDAAWNANLSAAVLNNFNFGIDLILGNRLHQ